MFIRLAGDFDSIIPVASCVHGDRLQAPAAEVNRSAVLRLRLQTSSASPSLTPTVGVVWWKASPLTIHHNNQSETFLRSTSSRITSASVVEASPSPTSTALFVVESSFLVEGFILIAHHTILLFGRHPVFANQVLIASIVIQVRSRGYWLPLQPNAVRRRWTRW